MLEVELGIMVKIIIYSLRRFCIRWNLMNLTPLTLQVRMPDLLLLDEPLAGLGVFISA